MVVGDRGWFRPRTSSKRVGCLGDRSILGLQVSRSIGSGCRAMQSCYLASLEPLGLFPALATLPLDPSSFRHEYPTIKVAERGKHEKFASHAACPLMLLFGMRYPPPPAASECRLLSTAYCPRKASVPERVVCLPLPRFFSAMVNDEHWIYLCSNDKDMTGY